MDTMRAFPLLDFAAYHESTLPELIASGHGEAARPGLREVVPLGLRIADSEQAVTYVPRPDSAAAVGIVPGDEAAEVVVSLSSRAWSNLVHDLESPPSLVYHDDAERVRGDMMQFVRWEPVLRALYTGRPVYDPARVDLRDRNGAPLDTTRGFTLDDDPDDMAHFLREAGYLLVKGAFSPDEVDAFRAAADRLRAQARHGDQASWWGRDASGEAVLCRVLQGALEPALAGLPSDHRIRRVVDLADVKMAAKSLGEELDAVTVLWKNPGVEEGLSDLPWHRDCGMGGHAAMCPTIVGSVFLGENTPEAGALRFLPGSWRASYRFADAADQRAEEGVLVPAEPGDFSIHYGDGWHAAPPPTSDRGPFRCCVLVSFEREGAFNHRGERHYNDVLLGEPDGQVRNMTRVAAES